MVSWPIAKIPTGLWVSLHVMHSAKPVGGWWSRKAAAVVQNGSLLLVFVAHKA